MGRYPSGPASKAGLDDQRRHSERLARARDPSFQNLPLSAEGNIDVAEIARDVVEAGGV